MFDLHRISDSGQVSPMACFAIITAVCLKQLSSNPLKGNPPQKWSVNMPQPLVTLVELKQTLQDFYGHTGWRPPSDWLAYQGTKQL